MAKERIGDRLRNLLSNIVVYDWIFNTPLEKILLIILILLGVYGLLDLIKMVLF